MASATGGLTNRWLGGQEPGRGPSGDVRRSPARVFGDVLRAAPNQIRSVNLVREFLGREPAGAPGCASALRMRPQLPVTYFRLSRGAEMGTLLPSPYTHLVGCRWFWAWTLFRTCCRIGIPGGGCAGGRADRGSRRRDGWTYGDPSLGVRVRQRCRSVVALRRVGAAGRAGDDVLAQRNRRRLRSAPEPVAVVVRRACVIRRLRCRSRTQAEETRLSRRSAVTPDGRARTAVRCAVRFA